MAQRVLSRLFAICSLAWCTACHSASPSYYPLTEGMTWEYQVTVRQRSPEGATQPPKVDTAVVTNLAPQTLMGVSVQPQRTDMAGLLRTMFLIEDATGVRIFALQAMDATKPEVQDETAYVLKYPVQAGAAWADSATTMLMKETVSLPQTSRIESANETVTVLAGTFANCVRVTSSGSTAKRFNDLVGGAQVQVEADAWYAPGVGLIKAMQRENSNRSVLGSGDITFELKQFKPGRS